MKWILALSLWLPMVCFAQGVAMQMRPVAPPIMGGGSLVSGPALIPSPPDLTHYFKQQKIPQAPGFSMANSMPDIDWNPSVHPGRPPMQPSGLDPDEQATYEAAMIQWEYRYNLWFECLRRQWLRAHNISWYILWDQAYERINSRRVVPNILSIFDNISELQNGYKRFLINGQYYFSRTYQTGDNIRDLAGQINFDGQHLMYDNDAKVEAELIDNRLHIKNIASGLFLPGSDIFSAMIWRIRLFLPTINCISGVFMYTSIAQYNQAMKAIPFSVPENLRVSKAASSTFLGKRFCEFGFSQNITKDERGTFFFFR